MKVIYLVRHAKAGWHDPTIADFERPLTTRGHAEADSMSTHLLHQGIIPELLVSSPATRALETAQIFADTLGIETGEIRHNIDIYEGDTEALATIVQALDDAFETIMLFGHNPTISSLIRWLTGKPTDAMETCGIARIDLECDRWHEAGEESGTLTWYEYPKKD
ncbi:MAG: histidine phosphatase family protein [Chlorobiaceae bacterium]|jgi:phosphohistidine phosphatase|nr:histidine phosphatase family protein [Chlorobiaceae bacterium]